MIVSWPAGVMHSTYYLCTRASSDATPQGTTGHTCIHSAAYRHRCVRSRRRKGHRGSTPGAVQYSRRTTAQLAPEGTCARPRIKKSLGVKSLEITKKLALGRCDVQKSGKVSQTPCLGDLDRDLLPVPGIFSEISRQCKSPQARKCAKVSLKLGHKPRSKPYLLVEWGQKLPFLLCKQEC